LSIQSGSSSSRLPGISLSSAEAVESIIPTEGDVTPWRSTALVRALEKNLCRIRLWLWDLDEVLHCMLQMWGASLFMEISTNPI
jgi:hypothetical protein